jgi:predicted DNA-binding transcriptional regulator YafY
VYVARVDRARRVTRLVAVLSGQAKGCSIQHIVRATNSSRATAYRDLELLRQSGYTLEVETVNGEARYSVAASALAVRAMTPRERAAIALARRALSSIEGTWLVRELDAVLSRAHAVAAQDSGVQLALSTPRYDPEILRVLHQGVTARRKLRIRYRGADDEAPRERVVHPVEIHVVDQQPYLIAWDELRRDLRTFKLSRVSVAKLLRDKAAPEQPTRAARSEAKAVKVWSTDPIDVRIRIAKPVARFVTEWPLTPTQQLEPAPRGAVDVCARVYGLSETLRWVLRWGKGAEVRAPEALRELVREELAAALAGYGRAERTGDATSRRPR